MKTFINYISFCLGILLIANFAYSQDLSDFYPIAHYTLINTPNDSLENYDTIVTINASFQGNEGIYSNGIYAGGPDTNGCSISTPVIDELDFNKLAISLEFKRASGSKNKPVLIVGGSWRWFGAQIGYDTSIYLICNDVTYSSSINKIVIEPDKWYNLKLIYQDSTGFLYVNNNLVDSVHYVIKSSANDKYILNTHGGKGITFKGNWRHLIIYKEKTNSTNHPIQSSGNLKVYPNPNDGSFTIFLKNSIRPTIQLLTSDGKVIYTKKYKNPSDEYKIITTGIKPGLYVLIATNDNGESISKKVFIK